jgi:hypothetical protein
MIKELAVQELINSNIRIRDAYILNGTNVEYIVDEMNAQPNIGNTENWHPRIRITNRKSNTSFSEELTDFFKHFSKKSTYDNNF